MSISKTAKKSFIFLFLATVAFVGNIVGDWLPPCKNSDDCGKIVGRIIDSDTNEIVKEEFAVSIFPFDTDIKRKSRDYYSVKTKTGHFSITVKPGIYTIAFTPYSSETKYPSYYNPNHPPSDDQIIKVVKGKITDITKKVSEGGYLKVILVNTNDQKLNWREDFKNLRVRIYLSNDDIGYDSSISMKKEEIDEGEIIIGNLLPGTYSINCYFPGTGYGYTKKEFVAIERKKITEYLMVIDPLDNTGIHGFVKDITGVIIKNVEIAIYKDIEGYGLKGFADTCSDEKGYYKIIGIDEGIYILRIETKEFSEFYLYNIKISKNKLLSKDIIVK
jgi:hypothetical protein